MSRLYVFSSIGGVQFHVTAVVPHGCVVVLTLPRIIKSVGTGQAPVTLELRNILYVCVTRCVRILLPCYLSVCIIVVFVIVHDELVRTVNGCA